MNDQQNKWQGEQQAKYDRETINIHRVSNGFIVGFPGHRMVFNDAGSMLKVLDRYFAEYKAKEAKP